MLFLKGSSLGILLSLLTPSSAQVTESTTIIPTTATQTASTSSASPISTSVPVSIGTWTYEGCYTDVSTTLANSTVVHALSTAKYASNDMSQESCLAFCEESGTPYAGLEYGRECHCGSIASLDALPLLSASECTFQCAGATDQTCGGIYKMSLFRASSSSAATSSTAVLLSSSTSSRSSSAVARTSTSAHSSSSSSSATAAISNAAASSSSSNTPAIAGAVIGILGAIAVIVGLILLRRKRSRARSAAFTASQLTPYEGGFGGGSDGSNAWKGPMEEHSRMRASAGAASGPMSSEKEYPPPSAYPLYDLPSVTQYPNPPPTQSYPFQPEETHSNDNPFLSPDGVSYSLSSSTQHLLDEPPYHQQQPGSSQPPSSHQLPSNPPLVRQTSLKRKPVPELSPEELGLETLYASFDDEPARRLSQQEQSLRRKDSNGGNSVFKGMMEMEVDRPSEVMR